MADDSSTENGLPPKLDLRKRGLPPLSGPEPSLRESAAPVAAGFAPRLSTTPSLEPAKAGDAARADGTMRITLPDMETPVTASTSPVRPALIRPLVSTATPTPAAASVAPAPRPAAGSPEQGSAPRPMLRPVLAPKTIKLKKPVPIGIKRESADLGADVGSKRSTSKISLPVTLEPPAEAVPVGTKTIRIAPGVVEVGQQVANNEEPDGTLAPLPQAPPPDPKRQTSRISLESVLGSGGPSAAPKTIKLQRPASSAIPGRVQSLDDSGASAAHDETSAEDLPAADAEAGKPEADKKTIKVKRPSVKPFIRSGGTSGASDSDGGPVMFAPPEFLAVAEDRMHWSFVIAAVAATVVSCVLIYVFLAQVLGPNVSMTEYSYGAPDVELAWPGRMKR